MKKKLTRNAAISLHSVIGTIALGNLDQNTLDAVMANFNAFRKVVEDFDELKKELSERLYKDVDKDLHKEFFEIVAKYETAREIEKKDELYKVMETYTDIYPLYEKHIKALASLLGREIEIELEDEEMSADESSVEPEVVEEEQLSEVTVDLSARESEIRAEIEAKIRYEYESNARKKAEEEIEKLRSENERIRTEFENQLSAAKREIEMLRAQCEKLKEEKRRIETVAAAQEAVRRAEEEKLRAQIELQLRTEARERERLAEAARIAIEEQQRLERERAEEERLRVEEARRIEEERKRAEEAARLEAERLAEAERIRVETERARAEAAKAALEASPESNYTYTSKVVRLIFRRSVDPNITKRIHEIIKATIDYYAKHKMFLKIRATVPDSQTVCLEFVQIPMEEMELLNNIIKILGNSGLGIAKAIVE